MVTEEDCLDLRRLPWTDVGEVLVLFTVDDLKDFIATLTDFDFGMVVTCIDFKGATAMIPDDTELLEEDDRFFEIIDDEDTVVPPGTSK